MQDNPLVYDADADDIREELTRWIGCLVDACYMWHMDDCPYDCLAALLARGGITAAEIDILAKSQKDAIDAADFALIDIHEVAMVRTYGNRCQA